MRKGILLGSDDDIEIVNGTINIDDSDFQNVSLILSVSKGDNKQFPFLGVGFVTSLRKQFLTLEELRRSIIVNLKADGYSLKAIKITPDGGINIDYQ